MTLAEQIVELKIKNDNLEHDFEYSKSVLWYEYAIKNRLIVMLFEKDELVGFLETIRLNYIPESFSDIHLDEGNGVKGHVILVANVVARNLRDLLKMKTNAIERNIDAKYFIWHSKKDQKMKFYKNIRRSTNEKTVA